MKIVFFSLILTTFLSAMSTNYKPIQGCQSDKDQDGVMDTIDQCPNTPLEKFVDSVGCSDIDSDEDGVFDRFDKCPNTPIGTKVNSDGCCADCDNDGVLNENDECPNTPKGYKVDEKGCSVSMTLAINFEMDSYQINQDSFGKVEKFAEFMISNPEYSAEIIGHTSNTGGYEHNMILSVERAEAVKTLLVRDGVEALRLSTSGVGPNEPIADNTTPEGRALNRRIEVKLIK